MPGSLVARSALLGALLFVGPAGGFAGSSTSPTRELAEELRDLRAPCGFERREHRLHCRGNCRFGRRPPLVARALGLALDLPARAGNTRIPPLDLPAFLGVAALQGALAGLVVGAGLSLTRRVVAWRSERLEGSRRGRTLTAAP